MEEEGLKKGHAPAAFEFPFLQTMGFKGIWSHPEVPVPTLFPVSFPGVDVLAQGVLSTREELIHLEKQPHITQD